MGDKKSNEETQVMGEPPEDKTLEAEPPEPPKKGKGIIIIIIVLILLLICACACAGSAFLYFYYTENIAGEIEDVTKDIEDIEEEIEKELEDEFDTTTTTTESEDEEEDEATGEFNLSDKSGGDVELMILRDIRFGKHPTFERLVLEFVPQKNNPEKGIPRYQTKYENPPYFDNEDNLIPLIGAYYLEIYYNAEVADLSVEPYKEVYNGPKTFTPNYSVTKRAKFVNTYEHNSLILLVGLSKKAPYRVLNLKNPERIVVDFKK